MRTQDSESDGGNIKTTSSFQAVADAERQKAVLEIKIQEQRIKVYETLSPVQSPLKQLNYPGRG